MNETESGLRRAWLDNAIAIGFAALFWVVIVLLIVFAVAAGQREGNPFSVFFGAFGAVGQVFFAAVVSWIAWQQYRHNQIAADRQARIDTFEMRLKLFEEYAALRRRFSLSRFDESAAYEFASMAARIDLMFPVKVEQAAIALGTALFDLADVTEEMNELGDVDDTNRQAFSALRKKRTAVNKRLRDENQNLYREMRADLKLRLDRSPLSQSR